MQRMFLASCLVLVAVTALALPSFASAVPTPLVVENGTAVSIGAKMEAVSIGNLVMTTSLGNIECTTGILTGELTKNTTGTVEAPITSAKEGGTGLLQPGAEEPECTTKPFLGGDMGFTWSTATNGLPWCIRITSSMPEDEFQLRGAKCSEAARAIRFALDLTGIGTCQYERATQTSPVKGTYTTSTTGSTLTFSQAEFPAVSGNPFGCPSSLKLDMTYQLRTDGGGTTLGITS